MIILENIYNEIKKLADESLAESWDNIGIMLGSKTKSIKKVLVCLDVTTNVVNEAINKNIDLIISHHPLIFKPLKNINFDNFKGNIIKELIKNDIAVISAHTNLDSAKYGLNDYMAKILELKNIEIMVDNGRNDNTGLGRIGELSCEQSIDDFVTFVKERFNLDFVKLVQANNKKIKRIAILGGSGGSFVYSLQDVDIYLTGDVGYHEAVDALEMGINILDIGHFAEIVCKELIKNYLENTNLSEKIEIVCSEVEKRPFEIK